MTDAQPYETIEQLRKVIEEQKAEIEKLRSAVQAMAAAHEWHGGMPQLPPDSVCKEGHL